MSPRAYEVVGPRDAEVTRRIGHVRRRLREGKRVDAGELHDLERAIRRLRPAVLVEHQSLSLLPARAAPLFPQWAEFCERGVARLLAGVARIDRNSEGRRAAVATGFLVAEEVLMTNRHVVAALTKGTGVLPPDMICARFGAEQRGRQAAPTARVVRVLKEHPVLDLALLELDRSDVAPLEFDLRPIRRRNRIAAIGYPSDDKQAPEYARSLFGRIFAVQRVAPGEVIDHDDSSFLHDCTTLAGNSGSPVVSLSSGQVIGVHAEGYYLAHNQAVAAEPAAAFVEAAC